MRSIYLPNFSYGEDSLEKISEEVTKFGDKTVIIYGEKAWKASSERILKYLRKSDIKIIDKITYGKDSTYENVNKLIARVDKNNVDFIIAVGGGKCIDTVKVFADEINKPIFTIPTIASNCSPITKISVMYNNDGSFCKIHELNRIVEHCFIDPVIIMNSPIKYFWAGMGDAMAKHIESEWSMLGGEKLDFPTEFGINSGYMCYSPIIKYGKKAFEDMKKGILSKELLKTILNVIISPAIVSLTVNSNYNGGIAHALFYGFTSRDNIEKNHLHGEVVAYGTLINLIVDKNKKKFKEVFNFNKGIGLPTKLKDLDIDADDLLEDVISIALKNQELKHTPYKVDREIIYEAIKSLERINIDDKIDI